MSRTAPRLFPLLLAAAGATLAHADEPAPARLLGAPVAMKLDWGSDAIRCADIDGDGRPDLAALNNDTGRIDILLRLKPGEKTPAPRTLREDRWNPALDDAPFRRLSVSGSVDMGSLALADLDGDGRIDIAYTSSRDALTVISRDKSGEWTQRRTFTRHESVPGDRTLVAADLDGDSRRELVMLSKAGLLVFPPIKAGEPLPEPKLYRTGADNPGGLSVADIDGDGRADIAYMTRGEKPELRVRFGRKEGGFGPERAFPTEYVSTDFSKKIPTASGAAGFAGVSFRKRATEIFTITRDDSPFEKAEAVSPALYATPSPLKSASLATTLDTPDAKGGITRMMFVADPKGAAIQVYKREASGNFGEPVSYPAPSNITSIAAGIFGKNHAGILVIGEKDGVLSYSEFDDKGRLQFPAPVKLDGTPLAMITTVRPQGYGQSRALVVVKKDKKASLVELEDGEASGLKIVSTTPLGDGATDAEDMFLAPFGVVILCGRSPAILVADKFDKETAEHTLVEIAKDSPVRKSMLTGITRADLGTGLLGTGKDTSPVLLVAAPGFVRALAPDDKGELVVKDQFNTRRPGDKPRCPFLLPINGESPAVLFYNETDKGVEWLARDDKGVYRHKRTILTGALDPVARVMNAANIPHWNEFLLAGRDQIADVDLTKAGMKLTTLERFETDLPGIIHGYAAIGNFTGGKSPEMALIDPRAHHLELVRRTGDGVWLPSMHWQLFDENPFYRGRRNTGSEPHDALVADLDGDGFDDLVLLMHDRLLLYPSSPASVSVK